MLPTHQYTLSAIESILYSGFQPKLMQSIVDIVNKLNSDLQVPEEIIPPSSTSSSSVRRDAGIEKKRYSNGGGGKRDHGKNKKNEVSAEEWDAMMAASAVVHQKDKEGLEKDLTSIRTLMNKVSTKNYETQKVVIHDAIAKYIDDSKEEEEDIQKLFKSVIDIIGTNKFFSELYANLFKDWFESFPVIRKCWDTQMESFVHSIDEIYSVDPNVDYDGYCNYTKINDKRKAYTTFVGNLCKKDVITDESVLGMIRYYLEKTMSYIDQVGRTIEVEEITENVLILTNLIQSKMQVNDVWRDEITPVLITISQMKMKEHASLSNRVVFKYMDIIENME